MEKGEERKQKIKGENPGSDSQNGNQRGKLKKGKKNRREGEKVEKLSHKGERTPQRGKNSEERKRLQ